MSIQASLRAMNDGERARARTIFAREKGNIVGLVLASAGLVAVSAGLGVQIGAVLAAFVAQVLPIPFDRWLGTFAVLGATIATFEVVQLERGRRERTRPLAEDVAGGIVEVLDVEAFVAWSHKDRVPSFLLDTGTEQQLHVKGDVLLPLVAAGSFPCRRFLLVRLPVTKKLLALEPKGEPLPVRA